MTRPAERIADALVLTFTSGVSLADWERNGSLLREWALYRRLRDHYPSLVLVTYGGPEDERIAGTLGAGVVCDEERLGIARFIEGAPARVRDALSGARRVVVKTNQMPGGEVAAAIAGSLRAAGVTAALVARGGYPWSRTAARLSGPDSPAAADAARREGDLCRAADLVVATTATMADDLAWRHALARDATAVVPNYVLVDGPAAPASARRAGEVLYAGRIVPEKRIDLLIDAMARLPESRRSTAVLRVIGHAPSADARDALRSRADAGGVRVSFEPPVPHADLLDAMRRCAVYAQVSAFEGHPKTVLEAMSTGAPVLVSASPGLCDVVRHGVTGWVEESDPDALARGLEALLGNAGLRESLGRVAAGHVRDRFGLDRVVELEAEAHRLALERAGRRERTDPARVRGA